MSSTDTKNNDKNDSNDNTVKIIVIVAVSAVVAVVAYKFIGSLIRDLPQESNIQTRFRSYRLK